MIDIYFVLYSFFIFSFFGWIWETSKQTIQKRTFTNRGFLNGPIIPIYGFGGTIVYLLLEPIKYKWYLVFILGMIIATILEYVTGFLMEMLFHAKWWDYSEYKISFQGRICLIASLFWGALSIVDLFVFAPFVTYLIGLIPRKLGEVLLVVFTCVTIVDFLVTVRSVLTLNRITKSLSDLREELAAYLVSSSLYERGAELREHITNRSISSLRNRSKSVLKEMTKHFRQSVAAELDEEAKEQEVRNFREDLDGRFKSFFLRYRINTERSNRIHKRLLKAFPNYRMKSRNHLLEDIKERWSHHSK